MCEAGDDGNIFFELPSQICCRCLTLDIRICGDDELGHVSALASLRELFQFELLGTHAIDRREDAVEHMVDTLVSRFFERNDVERFFRNENHALIAALIRTNGTELRNT